MAWKSFALGKITMATALPMLVDILNENISGCAAELSTAASDAIDYTYGGTTQTVSARTSSSTSSYDYFVFLNDSTGAFLLSVSTTTSYLNKATTAHISCMVAELESEDGQTELMCLNGFSQAYNQVFTLPAAHDPETTNRTNFITLVPLATMVYYNTSDTRCAHRPVAGLFGSSAGAIPAGTTIEVAGQRFLCVAVGMFAKL